MQLATVAPISAVTERIHHTSVSASASPAGARHDTSSSDTSSLKPASFYTRAIPPANPATNIPGPIATAATQIYRVGPGDVLAYNSLITPGRNSTLFTVLDDGVLEYPLAGNSMVWVE